MWFWIWTALVVGTLVGAFFLGRDLWRKAKALFHEMSRSSEIVAAAGQRASELSEEMARNQPSTAPTLFDDPVELQARIDELRARKGERRADRRARNKQVWRRWESFNE